MACFASEHKMCSSSPANPLSHPQDAAGSAPQKPRSELRDYSGGMQTSSIGSAAKRENSRPWFKFYTRDFRDGVRVLTLEEIGAYTLVLSLLYETGGRLKDDERVLCAQIGCDVRVWRRVRRRLLEEGKFTATEDGFLTNERATKEITSAELLSDIRRTSGRSGGQQSGKSRAKPMAHKESDEANASVLLDTEGRGQKADTIKEGSLIVGEPELRLTPDESDPPPRKRKPRVGATERTLPTELTPAMRTAADKAGYLNGTGEAQFDRWRDYHLAKGSLIADFDASFRTWIANAQRYDAQHNRKPAHDQRSDLLAGNASAASGDPAFGGRRYAVGQTSSGLDFARRLREAEERAGKPSGAV